MQVTVTEDNGAGVASFATFDVAVGNVAPDVSPASNQASVEGSPQSFALGTFADPGDDGPWQVTVDWGDGTSDIFDAATAGGLESREHSYADDGTYTVTLAVAEEHGTGATGEASFEVAVSNVDPQVTAAADQQATRDDATLFELGSFLDPGDDAEWLVAVDWGDGSDVAQFSVASAGSLGPLEHIYVEGGNFTVSVTVTEDDGTGQSGSDTFGVSVVDAAPMHSIAGYVYVDVDNDGVKDPQELVLPNVPITLSGPSALTVVTGSDGSYAFTNLPTARITSSRLQPLAFMDGTETKGTPQMGDVADNRFMDLQMEGSTDRGGQLQLR